MSVCSLPLMSCKLTVVCQFVNFPLWVLPGIRGHLWVGVGLALPFLWSGKPSAFPYSHTAFPILPHPHSSQVFALPSVFVLVPLESPTSFPGCILSCYFILLVNPFWRFLIIFYVFIVPVSECFQLFKVLCRGESHKFCLFISVLPFKLSFHILS